MTDRTPIAEGLFLDGPPRLLVSRCPQCSSLAFPRQDGCPYCAHETSTDEELAGSGTLWAFTAVTNAPPGYVGAIPYGFGVVEFGGIRVLGRLTEADVSQLTLGQSVTLVIAPLDEEHTTWAFAPEGS